ncbi:MAG: ATP-binding protein [Myxococcales bacterium]
MLPPLAALLVEWLFWPYVKPYGWFLYYPAVFASSWIGGRAIGVLATVLSTSLVWWFFIPPAHTILKDEVRVLFPAAAFMAMGVVFSLFHDRLRAALASLRDASGNLNRAQAVAKTGSWRLDVRHDQLRWTDETYRIFAIPRGTKMTYEEFLACVHPDDREQVDRTWQAALAGEPYDIEHRIVAGGAVKWVRERAELDFAGGALVGATGTVQDITERKGVEAALARAHETERRLRKELEDVALADSIISEAVADLPRYDLATVFHKVAMQAQSLAHADYVALGLGTNPEAPFEHWVSVGVDAETSRAIGHSPRPVGTLGRVARDGVQVREADIRRHPGFGGFPQHHPEMSSFLGVPIRYRGLSVGNLYLARKPGAAEFSETEVRVVEMLAARAGVAIETATLYAGEALQRAWLQTIIDQMPEAVVFVDEHRKVALQNAAARALARTDAEPFPYDVRLPDGAPVPVERLPLYGAVVRGESVLGAEFALADAQGRLVPVLVSATPVRVGGRISGAVGVFQDIRSLKEIERLREEWASLVAHDLRQPVHSISLALSLMRRLRKGDLSDDERRAFVRVQESSARLNRMIDDLLDASRLEARRLSVEPRPVDLAKLVAEMAGRFHDSGHPLEIAAEPGQLAWIDPDRIQQVLENLLSNAVKYGNPGGEIRIELLGRDQSIEAIVTNHGRGIPPEELPILFSRFARTRDARVGRAPGLGLGLYISQGLIEAQGGRMWVESTPGETTSFHFTVPRAPAPAPLRSELPLQAT